MRSDEADDPLVVRAAASAAEAFAADGSATGHAARVFSTELAARSAEGGRLAPAWAVAGGRDRDRVPRPRAPGGCRRGRAGAVT